MSNTKLKDVLNETVNKLRSQVPGYKGQSYIRNKLSAYLPHVYLIDAKSLFDEVIFELDKGYGVKTSETQRQDIYKSCVWYVETLVKAFKNNKFIGFKEGGRVKGRQLVNPPKVLPRGNNSYEIHFEASSTNIFRNSIKDIKRSYNRLLERRISRAISIDPKNSPIVATGFKTGGLVDLGHELGSSIADTGLSLALGQELDAIKRFATQDIALGLFVKKYGSQLNPTFKVIVSDESKTSNMATSSKGEKGKLTSIANDLEKVLQQIDWSSVEGSPSAIDAIQRALLDTAKGKKISKRLASASAKKIIREKVKIPVVQSRAPTVNYAKEKGKNWSSIIGIINSQLPSVLMKNMRAPALVNRTGTFASSARIISISETSQGYPSFGVTYNKEPYGVFDRRLGARPWATPERDPHTLIQISIREIATRLAIGRFYLRRE